MARDDGITPCGAVWYSGDGQARRKHVCHRAPGHRDQHHSDHGLWWSRHPYARRVRLDEHTPCTDCKPVAATAAARR